MAETLPMLEHDPRTSFRMSRLLRVLAFSIVLAIILTTVLIVLVRFAYDNFIAEPLGRAPYESNPLFVVPAMGVIAIILARFLWDQAEGRAEAGGKK